MSEKYEFIAGIKEINFDSTQEPTVKIGGESFVSEKLVGNTLYTNPFESDITIPLAFLKQACDLNSMKFRVTVEVVG